MRTAHPVPGRGATAVHPPLEEPIEVARRDDRPEQFILRDRLHLVRTVLAHWTEPGGWRWSVPSRLPSRTRAAAVRAPGLAFIDSVPVERADRDVWRVEAAAGMSARLQVFDLCRDVSTDPSRWTATLVEE
jgi:hypothetical protein